MRILSNLLLAAFVSLASACASAPQKPIDDLFVDGLFGVPTERISTAEVFSVDAAMRRYLNFEIAGQLRRKGVQAGLLEALSTSSQLKLEYDSARTKTAAEAFATRSGNCLSLVIMTAALARELKLSIAYRSAYLEETWSRSGDLIFASGHVNVTLGRSGLDPLSGQFLSALTIDFLPPQELRGMHTREISEANILAMYANNRAAEALSRDRLNDAYAWAVEALHQDPSGVSSLNTLGVVYLRHGNPSPAVAVFEHASALDPRNTSVLSNLARGYERQGRTRDAEVVRTRLAAIEPHPPFYFFNLGQEAAKQDDWLSARNYFSREVERADYNDEFHFWLGLANWRLGDIAQATKHLRLAADSSTTRSQHELYAAKLRWLQAHSRSSVEGGS